MRSTTTCGVVAALAALAGQALAQHAGDVILTVENGRIVTNIEESTGPVPERVFGAELGELVPFFTDEPGYDSEPSTFTPGSSIGFNIRKAILKWDGARFDAIPPEAIAVSHLGRPNIMSPPSHSLVIGFTLPVQANGQWHRHLGYTLTSLIMPTDGIYLLELELFSTDLGVGASDSYWIVFNQNRSEPEHDAAIDWVRDTLAGGGCYADCDTSTGHEVLDIFDFLCFQNEFAAASAYACDCDTATGAGVCDIFDFLCFQNEFVAGCR